MIAVARAARLHSLCHPLVQAACQTRHASLRAKGCKKDRIKHDFTTDVVCRSLADFLVEKEVYRGRASALFRAKHRASKMPIALKLYRKKKLTPLTTHQVRNVVASHCFVPARARAHAPHYGHKRPPIRPLNAALLEAA